MFFLIALAFFTVQCSKSEQGNVSASDLHNLPNNSTENKEQRDSVKVEPQKNIHYTSIIIPPKKKDSVLGAFKKNYSDEEQYIILALNRLDKKNLWRADTLMIPDHFEKDFRAYSPFPAHVDVLNDVKKFVVFSYPIQAYAAYENGNLVKWGPSSMGKKAAQTKRGLMFANWKKELAISTVDSEWKLPYNFNIHNTLGIGWHQYDLPGFPASHSCLRLLMDDAKWMYNFAETWVLNKGGATTKAKGTPVVVFGDYAWGKKKPWKQLYLNPKATEVSEQEMNSIITPYKDEILKEQQNREQVVAQTNAAKKDSI